MILTFNKCQTKTKRATHYVKIMEISTHLVLEVACNKMGNCSRRFCQTRCESLTLELTGEVSNSSLRMNVKKRCAVHRQGFLDSLIECPTDFLMTLAKLLWGLLLPICKQ